MDRAKCVVRSLEAGDLAWVRQVLRDRWGATRVVTRGRIHEADRLAGFVAEVSSERAGLATYAIAQEACEMVSLDSLQEGMGIGTALVGMVAHAARGAGCQRLWLITTNDNTPALRFYQRRGFRLVAVHVNALERSRELKPEIPMIGVDGIELRDEIELALAL